MKTALNLIGLCFGVVAAVCLYYASVETPWSMQSWSGQTELSGGSGDGVPGGRG
jgi:hypothetical protein